MQYQNSTPLSTTTRLFFNPSRISDSKVYAFENMKMRDVVDEQKYPKLLNLKLPYSVKNRKLSNVLPTYNERMKQSSLVVSDLPLQSQGIDQQISQTLLENPITQSLLTPNIYAQNTSIINDNTFSKNSFPEKQKSENSKSKGIRRKSKPNVPDIPYITNKILYNKRISLINKMDYRPSRFFNDSMQQNYYNENSIYGNANDNFNGLESMNVPNLKYYLQNQSTNVS